MKSIIQKILYAVAKLTLLRFHPKVVAITGSIGKTSAKEAISLVLKKSFSVRQSKGNYNNELGVPLTIIGEESGGKNPFVWVLVFVKAFVKLFTSYPEVLVLELGVDRPGDLKYLTDLVNPIDVSVITDIGIGHMQFFASEQELAKEKLTIIKVLPKTSAAVLNFDSPKVLEGKKQTKADIIGFGFNPGADLMASDIRLLNSEGVWGVNFKIHYHGTIVPFFLPSALGRPAVYAALTACGVGLCFNLNLVELSESLKKYQAPPGRLKVIPGFNRTTIIDDSYNAAPASVIAALETLKEIAVGRKIAAIGSMAELGSKSEWGHREVAAKIMELGIDIVVLVGEEAKFIQDELVKRKYAGRILWFSEVDQAKDKLKRLLLEKDTVLVKGSQSTRMEKLVFKIMENPQLAKKLLVRQAESWVNKP